MTANSETLSLSERVDALRDREPDPFAASADEVAGFVREVGELLSLASRDAGSPLSPAQMRFLSESAYRQVRFAMARLNRDREGSLAIFRELFALGAAPVPDGRYRGELVAFAAGGFIDPAFGWLTSLYLPWRGKKFSAENNSGDNVLNDDAVAKLTERIDWPSYRIKGDVPEGTIRAFPFTTYAGGAIEDPSHTVLKLDYSDPRNPAIVRRVIDELVELPGGYLLGKAYMRGFSRLRLAVYFGLTKHLS